MNGEEQEMIGSTDTEEAKFSEYIEEWYSSIRSSPPSQAPTGFDIHYEPLYPAEYIITQNNTWGNSNLSRLSPVVVYFNSGDLVNITQIQFLKEDDRIRGKLSESHNWITLTPRHFVTSTGGQFGPALQKMKQVDGYQKKEITTEIEVFRFFKIHSVLNDSLINRCTRQ